MRSNSQGADRAQWMLQSRNSSENNKRQRHTGGNPLELRDSKRKVQTQHYRPISGKSRTAEGKRSASSSPLFSTAGRRHAEEERFPRTQWEPRTRRRGERRASDRQQGVSEFTVCMGENLSWNFFITSWSLWKKKCYISITHTSDSPQISQKLTRSPKTYAKLGRLFLIIHLQWEERLKCVFMSSYVWLSLDSFLHSCMHVFALFH